MQVVAALVVLLLPITTSILLLVTVNGKITVVLVTISTQRFHEGLGFFQRRGQRIVGGRRSSRSHTIV